MRQMQHRRTGFQLLAKGLIAIAMLCPFAASAQFYNGSQLTFGKNRVQYEDFFWTYFRYDEFDTYFYEGGRQLAVFVSKYATEQIPLIEEKLDYDLSDKIQFIVFNRLSDLKQSNVGLISDAQYNVGGVTHIIGNKVFIYFDGNHRNLEQQVRSGIAHVILNEMVFGAGLTTKVKNSTLLTLPEWYVQGLVSYLATPWNTEIDERVRDGILSGDFEHFNRLTGEEAMYAGHSLWKYINDKYGTATIPNILYMTRVSRNVESGFLFVISVSFRSLTDQWISWYKQTYNLSNQDSRNPEQESFIPRVRKSRVYQQLRLNSDGQHIAYVSNEIGQYKVWIYDSQTGKSKRILKEGHKLDEKTDLSYPLLAWHPGGRLLAIILERKGELWLWYYDMEEQKMLKEKLNGFEKVHDFAFSPDGGLFTLSGVLDGQSDIFVFNRTSRTYERITNDVYDDLYPRFIEGRRRIIFASNRVDDTLRTPRSRNDDIITGLPSTTDLFVYDYHLHSNLLRRVTSTPLASEDQPMEYQEGYISFISDNNGIRNRYLARFDSAIAYIDTTTHYRYFSDWYPVTNYSQGIREQDMNPGTGQLVESFVYNGKYHLLQHPMLDATDLGALQISNSVYMNTALNKLQKELDRMSVDPGPNDTIPVKEKPKKKKRFTTVREGEEESDSLGIDFDNYVFSGQGAGSESEAAFRVEKARNYDVEYSINQLVNQIDFSYMNYSYQAFSGGGSPIFINPGFNALFKVGITDLLEDYRLTGSIRPSFSLDNMEYFFSYENLKGRLDKQLIFHRQGLQNVVSNNLVHQQTHELLYAVKWPFDQVQAVKGTAILRNDRAVFQALDLGSLQAEDIIRTRYGLKAEYIFDNTRTPAMNLYYGTRYKVFAEYYQTVEKKGENLMVVGVDFRHYQQIHRTFIWANRFAASSSFGNSKLIYYMGGVDGWLIPKFNRDINIDPEQNYAYQTLATNMRGFEQNIRNGNSFAVINSELRFPVFKYLLNRPIKSQFLENFQVVGFGDIGTAWTGFNPYSEENSLYKEYYEQGPIHVTVKNQKNPIVGGYGLGVRSTVLGYYVRADYAWGMEDGVVKDPIFYLSFSLDF